MSRTNRRKDYYARTREQYRKDTIRWQQWWAERGYRNVPTDKDVAKDVAMFGTDTKNYGRVNTQDLKRHSRRERRAFQRVEYVKSYRDWEYEFDDKIEPWLKRLIWSYD